MKTIVVNAGDDLQNILLSLEGPATIYLKKGVYEGKFEICADGVKIVGEDRDGCVLSGADFAKKRHKDGKEYNTFRTYTLCVTGERTVLENLTVRNSNTHPERVGQCVALSVNARLFRAKNVALKSTQDTLFTAPFPADLVERYSGRTPDPVSGENYYDGFIPRRQLYMDGGSLQLYENCKIFGTVDFIFGGAHAIFAECDIISLDDARGYGFVAAPSHSQNEDGGYEFLHCNFISCGAAEGSVHLARPWRDYGKSTFINCTLDAHINGELFDRWHGTQRDKTARFAYYNLTGIDLSGAVPWAAALTKEQASEIIKAFERCKSTVFDRF